MKVSIWVMIGISILASASVLTGCSKNIKAAAAATTTSSAESDSSPVSIATYIGGHYFAKPCETGSLGDQIEVLSFSADGTVGSVTQIYFSTSDGSCTGTEELEDVTSYTLDQLGTVTPGGTFSSDTPFLVNLTMIESEAAPQTAGDAISLNAENAGAGECGSNTWANTVWKNISSDSCSHLMSYNSGYQEFRTYWISGSSGSYTIHPDTPGSGACAALTDIIDASHRCTHEDSNSLDAYTQFD